MQYEKVLTTTMNFWQQSGGSEDGMQNASCQCEEQAEKTSQRPVQVLPSDRSDELRLERRKRILCESESSALRRSQHDGTHRLSPAILSLVVLGSAAGGALVAVVIMKLTEERTRKTREPPVFGSSKEGEAALPTTSFPDLHVRHAVSTSDPQTVTHSESLDHDTEVVLGTAV